MNEDLNHLHKVVAAGENFEAFFRLSPPTQESPHEVGILGGTRRFGVTTTRDWPTAGGGSAGTSEGHGKGGVKKALKELKAEYPDWVFDAKSLRVKSAKCELATKELKPLMLQILSSAFPDRGQG